MKRTPLKRKTPLGLTKKGTPRKRKEAKKKFTPAWYKTHLDDICKANIRSLGRCEAEGMFGVTCSGLLHAHHISRCYNMVNRWYEPNLICLCYSHHMHIHAHAKDEIELVSKLWGDAEYEVDEMDNKGNPTGKKLRVDHYDYLMWREHFLKWDRSYEQLYEYWTNKKPRS